MSAFSIVVSIVGGLGFLTAFVAAIALFQEAALAGIGAKSTARPEVDPAVHGRGSEVPAVLQEAIMTRLQQMDEDQRMEVVVQIVDGIEQKHPEEPLVIQIAGEAKVSLRKIGEYVGGQKLREKSR